MALSVRPETEEKIYELVESGRFESIDAVIAEALRLLELQAQNQEKLDTLRELIDEGFEGPFTPFTPESWEAGLARVRERYFAAKAATTDAMSVDATR